MRQSCAGARRPRPHAADRAAIPAHLGGNVDLFLNTLNWLSSDEELISIRPKAADNTPLDASAAEMQRILLGTVFGLPLLIIVAGIRVWWMRRA